MDWLYVWMILGSLWSWYAINDYYYSGNKTLSFWCEFISISLNALLFPIGIVFGVFLYFNYTITFNQSTMSKEIESGFVIVRLLTKYKRSVD